MEFKGRISRILPTRTGKRADGTEWQSQEFVFEYFENEHDRWSDKVVLSIMNDRIREYALKEGDEVKIGFGHSINEYNGRVFNELRIYKFEKLNGKASTEQPQLNLQTEQPQPVQAEKEDGDDMPF